MARPSIEQWEIRQMMLDKLESQPENLRFASNKSHLSESLHGMGTTLFDLSAELSMHADEWNKDGAIATLKEVSKEFNEADLVDDPQAPLKALLADTARFIASASNLDKQQACHFFENFSENSRGVFFDPRAGQMLKGSNHPKALIAETAQKLTMGMSEVSQRMMVDKAGEGIRQASVLSAKVNRPKSAFEIAQKRDFDIERAQKADPFAHLRGRDIKIERNEESTLDPNARLEPK